jgi:hypothetical protein
VSDHEAGSDQDHAICRVIRMAPEAYRPPELARHSTVVELGHDV